MTLSALRSLRLIWLIDGKHSIIWILKESLCKKQKAWPNEYLV